MRKYILLFIAASIFFPSCKDKEMQNRIKELTDTNTALHDSINNLRDSIKIMSTELKGYRMSPEKLCYNLDSLRISEDTVKLLDILHKLKKYHPESEKTKTVEKAIYDIQASIKKRAEEERKKRLVAVSKLKKNVNEIQGITWYYNPYFTHYNNVNGTSIYIGKSETSVWLRLKMSYADEDWIFFDSAYLSYDGDTKFIDFDRYKEKHTDNDGYGVWEYIDIPMNKELLSYLRKMVNGKKVEMQLIGEYIETRKLTYAEIQGIKAVLLAYDALRAEPGMTTFEDLFSDNE